jgi:hypothetical protein
MQMVSVELGRERASTSEGKICYYEPEMLCMCNQAHSLYFYAYSYNGYPKKVTTFKMHRCDANMGLIEVLMI